MDDVTASVLTELSFSVFGEGNAYIAEYFVTLDEISCESSSNFNITKLNISVDSVWARDLKRRDVRRRCAVWAEQNTETATALRINSTMSLKGNLPFCLLLSRIADSESELFIIGTRLHVSFVHVSHRTNVIGGVSGEIVAVNYLSLKCNCETQR